MALNNKFGKFTRRAAVAGLAALALTGLMSKKADAGLITDVNINPYNHTITTPSGQGGFYIDFSITNPYEGVTIDSAIVGSEFIEGFADSVTAINPNVNRQEIINYFNQTIDFMPNSDYRNETGWSESTNLEGDISITNNGILPGITYPEWTKDGTAILGGIFDAGWLDIDGTPGYNPLTDATLMQDAAAYQDIVTGTTPDGHNAYGDLDKVTAVPEPSTAALLGVAAGLAALRKRKE